MALKCAKCGYDNDGAAVICSLCAELLGAKPSPGVFLQRGDAKFGKHPPLPSGLAAKLASIAERKGRLRAVFLMTMSVNGSPPKSAFGFDGDARDAMREADEFLTEADPHMPPDAVSSDIQCLRLSREDRDALRPVAIVLLER